MRRSLSMAAIATATRNATNAIRYAAPTKCRIVIPARNKRAAGAGARNAHAAVRCLKIHILIEIHTATSASNATNAVRSLNVTTMIGMKEPVTLVWRREKKKSDAPTAIESLLMVDFVA